LAEPAPGDGLSGSLQRIFFSAPYIIFGVRAHRPCALGEHRADVLL